MAARVEALFCEKTVPQLRDYRLQLSQELVRAENKLRLELGHRYDDLLAVTKEVDTIFVHCKEIDASLMELCFNDSQYKLDNISEPQLRQRGAKRATAVPAASHRSSHAETTLSVASWTRAVRSFNKDPENSSNFDNVLAKFAVLRQLTKLDTFRTAVESHCAGLEMRLLEEPPSFTPSQLVQLHTFLHEKSANYEFQHLNELDQLIFDSLLKQQDLIEEPYVGPNETLVINFLSSAPFKRRLVEKLLQDAQIEIHNYRAAARDDTPIETYRRCDSSNITKFVQDIDLYCRGLTTQGQQRLFALVENTLVTLSKLRTSDATADEIASLKSQIKAILQKELDKAQLTQDDEHVAFERALANNSDRNADINGAREVQAHKSDSPSNAEQPITTTGPESDQDSANAPLGQKNEESDRTDVSNSVPSGMHTTQDNNINATQDESTETQSQLEGSEMTSSSVQGQHESSTIVATDSSQITTDQILDSLLSVTNQTIFRSFLIQKLANIESS
ncbi:LAMI_0D02498g1_1 [Lachancea mirantina]|uniref:LAMI_0D02498g1_1 n=1 Tax=Lachancea mirantina TaxID=1230905 RepID=A0A1G4J975_9SACH|nr:LAMI_0D02498g1_1 [Lachancea mirantina]